MTPGLGEVNTYIGHRDYCVAAHLQGPFLLILLGFGSATPTTTDVQSSNLFQLPISSPTSY